MHVRVAGDQDLLANRSEGAVAEFRQKAQVLPAVNRITIQQPGVSRPTSVLVGHRLCFPTHRSNTALAETTIEPTVLRPRLGFAVGLEAQAVEVSALAKAEHLRSKHKAPPLSSAQERELDEIMQEAETVLPPSQARQTMSESPEYSSSAGQCAVGAAEKGGGI
jgi:hypothetical protein